MALNPLQKMANKALWILPCLWMAALYWLSDQPGGSLDLPELFPHADKCVHAFLYFVLCFLLATSRPVKLFKFGWLSLCWLIAVAFALSDEYHQSFVAGRSSDNWDLVADAVGAACFVAFISLLSKCAAAERWKRSWST